MSRGTPVSLTSNRRQNYLMNGDFAINQRFANTTAIVSTTPSYVHDRFIYRAAGGSAVMNVSTIAEVPPNTNFQQSARLVHAGDLANNGMHVAQRIEADIIRPLVGQTVTFGAWVRLSVIPPSFNISIQVPNSGAEDNWADLVTENDIIQVSRLAEVSSLDWVFIETSFVVPSEASNGMALLLSIEENLSGALTWDTTGWQLNEGSFLAPFELFSGFDPAQELRTVQRYYEKSYNLNIVPGTPVTQGAELFNTAGTGLAGTSVAGITVNFRIEKRVIPTIVIYRTLTGDPNLVDLISLSGSRNGAAGAGLTSFERGINVTVNLSTANSGMLFQWTSDGEL